MNTNDATAEKPADRLEARAKQHCHDAMYFGTDGAGAVHCWSRVDQTVVVFERPDAAAETVTLPTYERETDTIIRTPGDWADFVASQRGDWRELRLSSGFGADLAEAVSR